MNKRTRRCPAALSASALLLFACVRPCDLDAEVRRVAGTGARDCGHVSVTGDPTPTDNCVLLAFKASTAFFARYDRPGTDSRVALGIARNSAGQTTYFHYDSDPCGGSSCGAIIDSIGCDGPSLWPDGETRPRGDPPIKCSAYKANARICQ